MSKLAFLFPGQGSQSVGMGAALTARYPPARNLFDQASAFLGWDLLHVCREGPEDRLRQTDIAQPALFVTGCAAAAVLRDAGVNPDAAAGHSIGEYAALASAGVVTFENALRLVQERGRLMQAATQSHPGGMAAVLGMDRAALQTLCGEIQAAHGTCVPVNFNGPDQIVVAGTREAIDAVTAVAPQKGAKRVVPLPVSGAFHSPLMAEAASAMREALLRVPFRDAAIPVAMNVDGVLRRSASEIQAALAKQLDHSVEWVQSIAALKQAACASYVECGAGRVLSGLVRRIDKQATLYSTETVEAIEAAVHALGPARKGMP